MCALNEKSSRGSGTYEQGSDHLDCHWGVRTVYAGHWRVVFPQGHRHGRLYRGRRNAGAWISALSYGTAYFSAVMFIGYSGGSGWSYGLWSVLVGVGNAVFGTLLAWLVLANRTRDITRRHDIKSMPSSLKSASKAGACGCLPAWSSLCSSSPTPPRCTRGLPACAR